MDNPIILQSHSHFLHKKHNTVGIGSFFTMKGIKIWINELHNRKRQFIHITI